MRLKKRESRGCPNTKGRINDRLGLLERANFSIFLKTTTVPERLFVAKKTAAEKINAAILKSSPKWADRGNTI